MSFETYLGIIIPSLVAIAIALVTTLCSKILAENVNEKQISRRKGKKGKRKAKKGVGQKPIDALKKYRKISIVFILLGAVVISATTIIYIALRPYAYNEALNRAEFEYGNHNYIEAAKNYNAAAYVAYNIETKVTAVYCEGACYLQLGLISNDDNYFSQALRKYYFIIDNKKYENAEYYQDALIDSSFALRELYGRWDDETLASIIDRLESAYDFSNVANIPLEKVDLMNKVALAIAQYYKYAANENFANQNKDITKELSDKAIYYYRIVCELMPQANEMHFKNVDLIGLYLEISELMIKGSISAGNYIEALASFDDTIKFCKSAIDTFESSAKETDVLNCYLRLKINLGKSYYLLSLLSGEEYLSEAYSALKPLLYLNVSKDTEYTLLDAGYYLILTKKCTEQELDIVLDRYENQIEGLTVESENYLPLLQSALEACNFIMDLYGENVRVAKKSEELSMEVTNLLLVYNN